jgi:flavin-dependent thymidylate synthase
MRSSVTHPQVALIDYTGAGSSDPLYAARLLAYTKNTRLGQGTKQRDHFSKMSEDQLLVELEYIATSIRTSWEFVDYVFEITTVTRAFTHQLVRTRTASFAQESQRSVDKSNFDASKPASIIEIDMRDANAASRWDELMMEIAETYAYYASEGVSVQDCRGMLPTNVLTSIIVKMNLRTAADILAKRKNLRAQGEYGEVAAQIEQLILMTHPWAEPFINPIRNRTPALDAILARLLGSAAPVERPEINAALKELDALKEVWG